MNTDNNLKNSYVMEFASGDNNDSNRPEPNRNQGGRRGYVSLIIIALLFVTSIGLMLYFLVFRNNTSSASYTDYDVVYNIDADHDGKADDITLDSNTSFPVGSFTIGDTYHVDGVNAPKSTPVIMQGGNSAGDSSFAPGTLAEILINGKAHNVTVTVTYSIQTSKIYYLSGTYTKTNASGRIIAYKYSARLNEDFYKSYVATIFNNAYYTQTNKDNNVEYYKYYVVTGNATNIRVVVESSSSWTSIIIPAVFLVVLVGLAIFLFRRMSQAGGAGNQMAGFVENRAKKQNGSKVRFADVAGCDEAKAELVEMVDYFHSTSQYTRLGAKLPHGVLLVGPPGTGKTLLAKAVAGEANVPFYSISGSDFVEMYVGVGASRVRSLFKTAKANAPCLIFIDEIDAVGRQRGAGLGGGNDEREQTLNELLVEMDGFEDNNGIIVMAATNRADVLDPALTRPGRFDRTITVDLPDKAGRAAILKVHSRNKKLASDVSFDSIASRTVGFSGADLANIMNEAAILAVRANRSVITTADIDEAIDRAVAGPAKKSHLEPNEKKQVAYHEAGHAVIGLFLPYSDVVQKITIIPRGRTGGHVLMTPAQDHFLLTKNQMIARITGYLGGRTSEEIFFGDVSTGASNDIEVATDLARSMVTQYGMSELGPIQYEKPGGSVFLGRDYNSTQSNYSTQIAFEIDKAVRDIIDLCHKKATELLTEHKDDVILIAETLIEHETITADQIEYLLKNKKLPEEDEHKLAQAIDNTPKNANNIVLYPGYEPFYLNVDKIVEKQPCRLVLVVSNPGSGRIGIDEFKDACTSGATDPSKIGVMFVSANDRKAVSLSVESFAFHIESYAGVPVLLIKTDEAAVKELKEHYEIA